MSLEEEFMSRGGRRGTSTPFMGTGNYQTRNVTMVNDETSILASIIISYAIGGKLPKTDYYVMPRLGTNKN